MIPVIMFSINVRPYVSIANLKQFTTKTHYIFTFDLQNTGKNSSMEAVISLTEGLVL
jgi:hypothetical protein